MDPTLQHRLKDLMQGCEGVILDFDGLIADSEPYHFKAYNEVFEQYGHSLDPEEYWLEFTSRGTGIQGEIDRHGLKLDASPEDMRRQKFEIYSGYCNSGEIGLFPEARRFITALSRHYRLAIASGSWEHDIRAILRHAQAEALIRTILGKAPGQRREKPFPDIFLEAARQLDLEPGRCLVVEDALKGLQAARDAGIPCIIIRNALNRNIEFPEADLVLPNLEEFVDFLEASPA